MSSFSNIGKRDKVRKEKRMGKKHLKRMYTIMDELDELALDIHNAKEEWTEDNIKDIASQYSDLHIAKMEKIMLLGKLNQLKENETKDNS